MKKLFFGFVLCFVLFASVILSRPRPTNQWLVRFDDNRSVLIEAESPEMVLRLFKKQNPRAEVYSLSRISYVYSEWIWFPE